MVLITLIKLYINLQFITYRSLYLEVKDYREIEAEKNIILNSGIPHSKKDKEINCSAGDSYQNVHVDLGKACIRIKEDQRRTRKARSCKIDSTPLHIRAYK